MHIKEKKKKNQRNMIVFTLFLFLAACSRKLIFEFLKPIKRFEGR